MKSGLTRELIALRVAKEFRDGYYVNLGIGLPTLASDFIPEGIDVILHSENGVLGYGRIANADEIEPDLVNAGSQPLTLNPGAAFFDSATSFTMIRGRHIDLTVMGAFQVSEKGDLANWSMGKDARGGWLGGLIGGAMDLAIGAKRVYVTMTHTEKDDKPKILKKCTYPLTAKEVVKKIFTNISVIDVTKDGLVLREVAPGWTAEEVQALTEPKLIVAEDLKTIEL